MPKVSIIIPCYNVAAYIEGAIRSALIQTYQDFEILIIDDGCTDNTIDLVKEFTDYRIRIISQENAGLNAARNTGIRESKGEYFAYLDADDLWHPEKIAAHVQHLDEDPSIGISFSWSQMIDEDGRCLGISQAAKVKDIKSTDIFCRNPIGNGSAAVIRRKAIESIVHYANGNPGRRCYFDESFAQSTDIECWMRFTLETTWKIEGIPQLLTSYRITTNGLSANILKQYQNWEKLFSRTSKSHPVFIAKCGDKARAYQLRYLARRAVQSRERGLSWALAQQAITAWPGILREEFSKTTCTLIAAFVLRCFGTSFYSAIESSLLGAKIFFQRSKGVTS